MTSGAAPTDPALEKLFSEDARRFVPSAIRAMAALINDPTIISFAAGVPNPETFPKEALAHAATRILSESPSRVLQYDVTAGYLPLRERIASRVSAKGLLTGPSDLVLTTGSQQALDLAARVLLDPGDAVLVELPTYVGGIATLAARRARIVGVPRDASGLDLERLERAVLWLRAEGTPVKALYTIPNFQNPSGLSMSGPSKDALAATLDRLGLVLLEDDPYGELGFQGGPEVDATPVAVRIPERSAYFGSFSKTLAAGLRTGWVKAPPRLLAKLELAKQAADLCSSTFDAALLHRYLEDNDYDAHIENVRGFYRARKDALLAAMREHFSPEARFTDPRGGLFTWVTLPEGLDAKALLPKCVAETRTAYVPGEAFLVEGDGRRLLRMTFAKETHANLLEGAKRLGAFFRDAGTSVSRAGVPEPLTA